MALDIFFFSSFGLLLLAVLKAQRNSVLESVVSRPSRSFHNRSRMQ